jgi:hypothetical protein
MKTKARGSDLFAYPENTFSTGAELIELLQRKGIGNPITKEPILLTILIKIFPIIFIKGILPSIFSFS